jgi:small-conductance mechanosensitive channel
MAQAAESNPAGNSETSSDDPPQMTMDEMQLQLLSMVPMVATLPKLRSSLQRVEAAQAELQSSHEELQTSHTALHTSHEELLRSHAQLHSEHNGLQRSHVELQSKHEELQCVQGEQQISLDHFVTREAEDTASCITERAMGRTQMTFGGKGGFRKAMQVDVTLRTQVVAYVSAVRCSSSDHAEPSISSADEFARLADTNFSSRCGKLHLQISFSTCGFVCIITYTFVAPHSAHTHQGQALGRPSERTHDSPQRGAGAREGYHTICLQFAYALRVGGRALVERQRGLR